MAGSAEVRGVTERVDVSRGRHEPVTAPAAVGHNGHRGARTTSDTGARSGEVRVAEGEDPSVGGHHEVAVVVDRGDHAHNGHVEAVREPRTGGMEPEAGYGAVELRVAVAEDPAVGGVEPVPAVVRRGHDTDHRPLQAQAPCRSIELGLTEGEDPAVGAHEPVPTRLGT